MKTNEELAHLRKLGLKIAYMGLESGDNKVLEAIRKGADADKMITMGKKLKKAGIKVSVTSVAWGLGAATVLWTMPGKPAGCLRPWTLTL